MQYKKDIFNISFYVKVPQRYDVIALQWQSFPIPLYSMNYFCLLLFIYQNYFVIFQVTDPGSFKCMSEA